MTYYDRRQSVRRQRAVSIAVLVALALFVAFVAVTIGRGRCARVMAYARTHADTLVVVNGARCWVLP